MDTVIKKYIPNYENLFGPSDICECEDCRSVTSPAAYFVDILRFLQNSSTNDFGRTPLDILLTRRPDLEHLPLTCENTKTVVPYIDLVNEVMEYFVANFDPSKKLEEQLKDFKGYDTGETNSAELRANPQNTKKEAYEKIKEAVYPFSLPYHQPLDVIRKYLDHLGTTRYELMENFRNDQPALLENDLSLAAEFLNLSEEEYKALTDNTDTWKYYGYPDETDLLANIFNVKEFLKRTGILYKDLVEIVKTKFINPYQDKLDYLDHLFKGRNIPSTDLYSKLQQIKDGSLEPSADEAIMNVLRAKNLSPDEFKKWVTDQFDNIGKIITLYNQKSECNLEETYLKSIKSIYGRRKVNEISNETLSRIHRFIRLWRKTGWDIHDLDNLITALGEDNITSTLILKVSAVKKINEQLKLPLVQLACLWGYIDTYGPKSLYERLFLNKSLQQINEAFRPNKFGNYLSKEKLSTKDQIPTIKGQVPTLLAAFRLNAEQLTTILNDAQLDINNAKLTLENLSIIYRYVVLAKAVNLKASELCLVKALIEEKPFSKWNKKTFIDINPIKTLSFLETINKIKNSGFRIPALNYIFKGLSDAANADMAIKEDKIFEALKNIRVGFQQIEQEHPESDKEKLDEELLRKKLSILFAPEPTEILLAILNYPLSFKATADIGKGPSISIPSHITKITYNSATGILECNGFLTDDEKDSLLAIAGTPEQLEQLERFKTAIQNIFTEQKRLSKSNQLLFSTITDTNLNIVIPEQLAQKITYVRGSGRLQCFGILLDHEKTLLENLSGATTNFKNALDAIYKKPEEFISENFAPLFGTGINDVFKKFLDHPSQLPKLSSEERRKEFYEEYLPYLKKQLIQNLIVQNISAMIGLDEPATQILISEHIENLTKAFSDAGLYARYYKDTTFTESQLGTERVDPFIDFTWKNNAPDPLPAGQFSVRWEGWICAPVNADYTFIAEVEESDEEVRLFIDDQLTDLNKPDANKQLSWETDLTMKAGRLYRVKLEYVQRAHNAGIRLYWKTGNTSKEIIPGKNLYPLNKVNEIKSALEQYQRAALFINGFKLNKDEIEHFKKWKGNWRADGDDFSFTKPKAGHWKRIYEYVELRKTIPQASSTLISIFEKANQTSPVATIDDLIKNIVAATSWNKEYLTDLVKYKFILTIEAFKNETALARLQKALKLADRTGASATQLADWAKFTTEFDELSTIAQNIKNAVKAKYEEEDWLKAARGISNKIRENQKQALISYLLVQQQLVDWGVVDADSLFEYFLIDVQMGACLDTSRIKQAISSVQLFINRCLLNLESRFNTNNEEIGVSPIDIATGRWEWMKNYRVWEANRKIFLYPENWLEPEWRDDKSSFFKELESELLQNDITDQNVENAFRNYLYKLNEVSNMEVCGMYQDIETAMLHVFARTHATPYHYYYRTRDSFKKWSAWEKVPLDIRGIEDGEDSGVHLIPVVWKSRLFLFWPEFFQKQEESKITSNFQELSEVPPIPPTKYWEIKLAWSEYRESKWTPKQISKENLVPGNFGYEYIADYEYQSREGSFGGRLELKKKYGFCKEEFEEKLKNYRISTMINNHEELIITLSLKDVAVHGKFFLPDVQNPFTVEYRNPFTVERRELLSAAGILLGAESNNGGELNKSSVSYMSFENPGKLVLKQNEYLQSPIEHTILYSHQLTDFETTLNYPFFYQDKKRVYFAEPVPVKYSMQRFRKQDNNGFAPLEQFKDNYLVHSIKKPPLPNGPNVLTPKSEFASPLTNSSTSDPDVRAAQPALTSAGSFNMYKTKPQVTVPMVGAFEYVPGSSKKPPLKMQPKYKQKGAFAGKKLVNGTDKPLSTTVHTKGLRFYSFFHPYAAEFNTILNRDGMSEMMAADIKLTDDNGGLFDTTYDPNDLYGLVQKPLPKINVDFDEDGAHPIYGAYSIYNWELFFHIPLFIATRLSKNGKYFEAMRWFHFIFDPTTNEVPDPANPYSRYWKVLPFKTGPTERIDDLLKSLQSKKDSEKNTISDKINEWIASPPFKPHLVARGRPVAYMKNVVFKYVSNIVAWADDLFRRDTMESINEATQLYVIAAHILGPKPQFVPKRGGIKAETFDSIKARLDDFSNALVQLENIFPSSSEEVSLPNPSYSGSLLGAGNALYFCIPNNESMLKHWKTVGDRLYNIRHCMNIDGVERALELFEPQIEPGLLIAAAAKGLSIGSILSDLNSPAPLYRFNYLSQKATEFCAEVKALGSALLSAIEKKDAEELSRKRAMHEVKLLEMVTAVKERQVLEANANKQGLVKSRESAKKRLLYYLDLLGVTDFTISDSPQLPLQLTIDSTLPADTIISDIRPDVDISLVEGGEKGVKLIPKEKEELDKSKESQGMQFDIAQLEIMANHMHLIPDIGAHSTPIGVGIVTSFGGKALGWALSSVASSKKVEASDLSYQATQASKMSAYIRREQEWVQQANIAAREIIQIDKQITVSDIRIQIAQKELDNHKQQIENSKEVEQFLKEKFTNQELYQWMKEQLFAVYKQSYQLAYDMAKKAEKAFRFEIGRNDTSFIQYGYWDSSYEGLTAGEKLHQAIKQMEKAYIEENKREFELTKHISVAMLNSYALLELKQTGSCEIDMPEELFDLDYPGHYFRRLKSVSITIPCIVGPYTTVNSTLRLLKNSIRINTFNGSNGQYEHNHEEGIPIDDERFVENNIPFKSIATSSAQNDSGVFELNFRDERYLPFEGAGVICKLKLELNGKYLMDGKIVDLSQFDYNSISDVIIHLRYTAREDAGKFRQDAIHHLEDYLKQAIENAPELFMRLFSLKQEFPEAFHQLINVTSDPQKTEFEITNNHFHYLFSNKTKQVKKTQIFLKQKSGVNMSDPSTFKINGVAATGWIKVFNSEMKCSTIPLDEFDPVTEWTIEAGNNGLKKEEIDDVLILVYYKIE